MTDEEWKKHWREIVAAASNDDIYPEAFGWLCWNAGDSDPESRAKREAARAQLLRMAKEHGWRLPND